MNEYLNSIDKLLTLDERELTVKLAETSELRGKELLPFDPEAVYNYGLYLIKIYTVQVQDAVCKSEKVIGMLSVNTDEKMIVLEIISILVSLRFQVSPVVLAVLLVKKGLTVFCKHYWGT